MRQDKTVNRQTAMISPYCGRSPSLGCPQASPPAIPPAGVSFSVAGSTLNKLSLLPRGPTLWGDVRRSRNKGYRSIECSRCPSERDTTGTYCKRCRRAYRKMRRILMDSA